MSQLLGCQAEGSLSSITKKRSCDLITGKVYYMCHVLTLRQFHATFLKKATNINVFAAFLERILPKPIAQLIFWVAVNFGRYTVCV